MLSLCHLCSSTMKGALVHRQAIGRLSTQHCPGRPRVVARPSSAAAAPRKQAQPLCGIRSSPLVARPPPLQMQQPSRPAERGCARATASINVMSRSRRRRNLGIGSSSDGAREFDMLLLQGGRQDVGDERFGIRQVADHPFPSADPTFVLLTFRALHRARCDISWSQCHVACTEHAVHAGLWSR